MNLDSSRIKQVQELVDKHGSPLAIFESGKLSEQYRLLQEVLPNVALYFAVKSLPRTEVIATLNNLNAFFDVATIGEIELLQENGVLPDQCIFTHPIKKIKDIETAIAFGISTFVVDNEYELEKFVPYKNHVKLLIRISFPNDEAEIKLFEKFGTTISGAVQLLKQSRLLEIDVCGISFHVGSRMQSPTEYINCIEQCAQLFAWSNEVLNLQLSVLDIGGGFPCFESEASCDRTTFFTPIVAALKQHFPKTTIIAEPGRSVSNSCVSIVTSVVGKTRKEGKFWYYLDEGLYGTFSGQCFDNRKHRFQVLTEESKELYPCVIAGPTCDSFDTIDKTLQLPELHIQDLLMVDNMGAYTLATSTNFNSIEQAFFLHRKDENLTLEISEKSKQILCTG